MIMAMAFIGCAATYAFQIKNSSVLARATLRAGDTLSFSFSYTENAPAVLPPVERLAERVETCIQWWKGWTAQVQI